MESFRAMDSLIKFVSVSSNTGSLEGSKSSLLLEIVNLLVMVDL
jgi:hypothetical protein